eukprot:15338703-Ditylum_brightwellii.AAC.4
MAFSPHVSLSLLEGWLEDSDTSLGTWRERFSVLNLLSLPKDKNEVHMEDINVTFLKQAQEAHTLLKGKQKLTEMDEKGEKLFGDIDDDLAVLHHVEVSLPSGTKKGWKSGQDSIPPLFTQWVEAIKESVNSLLAYVMLTHTNIFRLEYLAYSKNEEEG